MQQSATKPTHGELEAPVISLGKLTTSRRLQVGGKVFLIVLILSLMKALVQRNQLEFLSLNTLFTSAIGASIFIIGFLLSSIMRDYKEAERLPTEIRVALEGIHDDVSSYSAQRPGVDVLRLRITLVNIVRALSHALASEKAEKGFERVLHHIDNLSPQFAALDVDGMQPNFVTRLRTLQDLLRRSVFRIYHIQRTLFVPSVHVLVQSIVALMIVLMLFLETTGSIETALLFAVIAYLYIYALYLIDLLEQPFRKGLGTLDDVSLFLLREFDAKLTAKIGLASPNEAGPEFTAERTHI